MAEFVRGTRVCILGWGTAAGVHTHQEFVARLTKTMIVTGPKVGGEIVENSRFNQGTKRSTGHSEYGWRSVALTCQRPKGK